MVLSPPRMLGKSTGAEKGLPIVHLLPMNQDTMDKSPHSSKKSKLESLTHITEGLLVVTKCRRVPRTGLEPVAYGLEVRCSIQLSYRGNSNFLIDKSRMHLYFE